MTEPYILGLSSLVHNPAAALLAGDGTFMAAMEESKLARTRDASGIPREAIRFCLDRAGISSDKLSLVGVASRPGKAWLRGSAFRLGQVIKAPIPSGYYLSKGFGELGRELNNLRILKGLTGNAEREIVPIDHQHCHAASAFYCSPFDKALVLCFDERGDGESGTVAIGEGTNLKPLHIFPFPNSIGWVYSQVTELLGYTPHADEHKLQWLGLSGSPVYKELFVSMLSPKLGAAPRLDSGYFQRGYQGRLAFSSDFCHQIGIPHNEPKTISEGSKANIAASLLQACEEVVVEYASALRQKHGVENLCLAGGLFLNPLIVSAVEKNAGFSSVFVQPAAGNEGTALGAALSIWHEALHRPRVAPLTQLYLGPSFSNDEIKRVLDNSKAAYQWTNSDEEKIAETARLLEAGKIVAWFQGAAEFGPRALGNRSLLASPWAPYVRENLNDYVKHRESFRPFALAITDDDCEKFFDAPISARFMASMSTVKPEAREIMKSFLLPGDQVRLQVVSRASNPLFWQLIKRSGANAPAPLLVNTSFNLFGEPSVVTPRDAVRSYFCSGTDALVIGNFILKKS
jgi:carbamoyltransferase